MRTTARQVVMIVGVLALALSPIWAQDATSGTKPVEKPDATLRLSQASLALVLGYTWGSGSLTFQDKIYRVEVGGFSVLALGFVKAEASGEVFKLDAGLAAERRRSDELTAQLATVRATATEATRIGQDRHVLVRVHRPAE